MHLYIPGKAIIPAVQGQVLITRTLINHSPGVLALGRVMGRITDRMASTLTLETYLASAIWARLSRV